MSRIANVIDITSTEFDGRFEVLGCQYINAKPTLCKINKNPPYLGWIFYV